MRAQEEWDAYRDRSLCVVNCEPTVIWPFHASGLLGGEFQCKHGVGMLTLRPFSHFITFEYWLISYC